MSKMSDGRRAIFKPPAGIEHHRAQAYDFWAPVVTRAILMKRFYLVGLVVSAAIFLAGPFAVAQTGPGSQFQSQGPNSSSSGPAMAPQEEENDSTLELTPQPGAVPIKPKVEEIPGERNFRPDSDTASINRNFNSGGEGGGSERSSRHGRPYLGIEVQYASECFKGAEEYGLKITKVDPNSPAWAAGLRGPTGATSLGAAGVTAGTLLGPLNTVVNRLLEKAGSLGVDGDLIVAVDDQRIRNQADLDYKMAQLKPGDTLYLTVIRPTGDGNHKTLKIAVKVGEWGQPLANAEQPSNASAPH